MQLQKVKNISSLRKTIGKTLFFAGFAFVTIGFPLIGLFSFMYGAVWMEYAWRDEYGFKGSWFERFEYTKTFYAQTHKNTQNRLFHRIGIPLILFGALLLIVTPIFGAAYGSFWTMGFTTWAIGWAFNLYGHRIEGAAPALTQDPLGPIAGPFFDFTGRLKDDYVDENQPINQFQSKDTASKEAESEAEDVILEKNDSTQQTQAEA